jgi:hypothetical protein
MSFTSILLAQDEYRVDQANLEDSPDRYLNNIVIIDGVVDRHLPDQSSAGFFYIRDDFGDFVRIRVLDEKPEVNKRVQVSGVFTREIPLSINVNFLRRYFIDARSIRLLEESPLPPRIERQAVIINSEPSGAEVAINGRMVGTTPFRDNLEPGTYSVTVGKTMYEPHSMNLRVQDSPIRRSVELERGRLFYGVVAGSGVVLLLLVGVGYIAINRRENKNQSSYSADDQETVTIPSSPSGSPSGYSDDIPAFNEPSPESTVENKTVKINIPQDHTIKVLDEYFEVIEGLGDISKLHLYQRPDNQNSEYTFGRNAGTEYYHIQLKSPAVSRNQAKLIVTKDSYVIINYAKETSNPTRINDREMEVNESAKLNLGDTVTMGDVKLKFTSKRA